MGRLGAAKLIANQTPFSSIMDIESPSTEVHIVHYSRKLLLEELDKLPYNTNGDIRLNAVLNDKLSTLLEELRSGQHGTIKSARNIKSVHPYTYSTPDDVYFGFAINYVPLSSSDDPF